MNTQSELIIVRRAYAKQTLAAAGILDPRLRLTFHIPGFYKPTPDADPWTDSLTAAG